MPKNESEQEQSKKPLPHPITEASKLLKLKQAEAIAQGRELNINVLDIDDTLLVSKSGITYFKCPEAWKTLMAQEKENDTHYNTDTIWLLGSFRCMNGGIYQRDRVEQRELVPHIRMLLEKYSDYLHPYGIITTGNDDYPYSEPGCKVTDILDRLHKHLNVPKHRITIFDDQQEGVIEPAIAANYNAVLIPEDPSKAEAVISNSARPSKKPACEPDRSAPAASAAASPPRGTAKRKADLKASFFSSRDLTAHTAEEQPSKLSKLLK